MATTTSGQGLNQGDSPSPAPASASDSPPPSVGAPYADVLTVIAKGLKDPVLLFGLGAGIVVVAALAFTSNVALTLIVAAVLMAALVVRLFANVRRARLPVPAGDIRVRATTFLSKRDKSPEARIETLRGGPSISVNATEIGSRNVLSPAAVIKVRPEPKAARPKEGGEDGHRRSSKA